MNKILLLILFALLSFSDQIFYERDDVISKEGILYTKSGNEPLTGVLRFKENWAHIETQYIDGKIDGTKSYHKNGNIKAEIPYKNGKINGISKEYYETGELETESLFKNGKKDGTSKRYHKNGKINAEIPYKNGKINGITKYYYETGELKTESLFKNDKTDGTSKSYYKNGNIKAEIPYKNGKINGISKEYYETGELETESLLKNGEKDGTSKSYYKNGNIKAEIPYKNGKVAGLVKHYDNSGTLKHERLGKVDVEDLNSPAVEKLAKDYPVTEEQCQIEDESVLKVIFARYLSSHTAPSFPEDGVVKFDYNITGKYGGQREFNDRVISFMFKDSETCNRFLDEFDAKIDYKAYNECKAKAHAEYRESVNKTEAKGDDYNIYLTKMKQCEWLLNYD